MKEMSSIKELNQKMKLIAESVGLSLEKFRKLPRKKFIAICNDYNSKNK